MNCPSCRADNEASRDTCGECGATLGAPTAVLVAVDLSPGTVFHGRYEIRGSLGRGGMGMVYEARDRSLDETVAIKVLRPDFAQDPRMADRFKSEIKLARRIRHRNVCAIHDYGEDRGLLYISMELIEGRDLKHVLKERGGLPPDEAYDLAIQVAEGLQAVHEAGIIHRDLKTPNIMVDARGVARLMDFGIAKRHGEGTLTATGNIVGTPEYMSPEQAQGRKVDFRSDIYALGIVVYEIFTGQVPFRGETPISTILKHINDPPPLEGPAAARLPPALKPVLRRMLAKEPADRPANAREASEALRRARSPSARQQPVSTDALLAPTLAHPTLAETSMTDTRRVSQPRPRLLQPWLLAVPAVAVAGAALLVHRAGGPDAPLAPPVPSSLAAAMPTAEPAASPPSTAPAGAAVAPVAATSAPSAQPLPEPRRSSPAPPTLAAGPARYGPATPAARPPTPRPLPPPPRPAETPVAAAGPTPAPRPADESPGLLQVAVIPWGQVTVDGKVVGTTPLDRIPLGPGAHTVRVRHPAYEIEERTVTIRSGQLEKLVVNFPAQGVRKQP